MTEPRTHDLFLSYRTDQAARALPLLHALAARGVRVWRDVTYAHSGDSITDKVLQGLDSSRALAVFATEDWPKSSICARELNRAWTAAERLHAAEKTNKDDPAPKNPCARRILFLKPHDVTKLDHVRFGALSDCRAFELSDSGSTTSSVAIRDASGLERILWQLRAMWQRFARWVRRQGLPHDDVAQAIKTHLDGLDTRTFGDAGDHPSPAWYPHKGPKSNRFVGRDRELWQLHSMLTRSRFVASNGHQDPDIAQLRGLGGLGKTLLASRYAYTFAASWPGGIFWLTADPAWATEPDTEDTHRHRLNVLLDKLAESLKVAPSPGDRGATAAAVRRAIDKRTAGKPYLWVIDNLPPGLSQAAVTALAPPTPDGAFLVTTRDMALDANAEHLDLDVLDPDAAFTLLTARRPPTTHDESTAALALAADVGHHPLALDILGALVRINITQAPYAHWRTRLAAPGDTAFDQRAEALKENLPTSCARSITRVLETSLALLESDLALDILRLSALLADAPIPTDLIVDVLDRFRSATPEDVEKALDDLASHALITRDQSNVSISVHAIVQWVAERWNLDEPRLDGLAEVTRALLHENFADIDDIRTHAPRLALVAHAQRLAEPESTPAARLGGQLAIFFQVRGDYVTARMLSERALAVFERILGPEHPGTLTTLQNLAGTLKDMGDLQGARLRLERALAARERLLGPEHPDTLSTLQNLAVTLQAMGNLQGARLRLERALAATDRSLGPEHPDTLRTLRNLAATLKDMGDLQGAHHRLERALAATERILGPEHPDTLTTLQYLAATLKAMGDLRGARLREERVLAARERILGPEHPDTLGTLQNLAGTLKDMGDLQGARLREERALAARERILGPEHPDTLGTLQNLAGTLHAMGDLKGARLRLERALAAFERILGPEHPNTLNTLQNLSLTLHAMGDLKGARLRYERALAAKERILGLEHSDTHVTRFNLFLTLRQLDPPAADEHLRALRPLLNRPPDQFSWDQRKIVETLVRMLGPASTTSHESAEANPLVLPQLLKATATSPSGFSRRRRRPQRPDPSKAP